MSKKLNDDTENYDKDKEIRIMANAKLQATFDVLVDNFDYSDEIGVENTRYEMHKNWLTYLDAGFDAGLVVMMMSPADIWDHYEELLVYGAELNINDLLSKFSEDFFDEDFIKEHWETLVGRGASPDFLVDRCYAEGEISDVADLEKLFTKGVSVRKAFELVKEWLEALDGWPEEQIEILTCLYDHGLPKDEIKEWLEKNAHGSMDDYIIESGSDFYKKFGMEEDDIINRWLDCYGYEYFGEHWLSELPKTITVERLIDFFSMKEIINNCSPYCFEDFLLDYLEVGKDIDTLAHKFMNEIGYSNDSPYSGAMLDLIRAGASVDIIDPEKYIYLVDVNQLNDYDAGDWYDYFESNGYDSQLISKFRR